MSNRCWSVRIFEGLGFITVVVAVPSLLLRLTRPGDQRLAMAIWSTYMPAGAGTMMVIAAIVLPGTSWRIVWLVAAAAAALMAVALLLRAVPRRELDPLPVAATSGARRNEGGRRPAAGRSRSASASAPMPAAGSPIVGFLPTLQIERLGFSTSTAAIVTAVVAIVNVTGNLAAGWLLHRGVPRVVVIVGATLSMACAPPASSSSGVPDLLRLVLAGVYSAVIGVVPGALFTAIPDPCTATATRRRLDRPADAGLQHRRAARAADHRRAGRGAAGWPSAAWLTSVALGVAAAAGLFLHWRERRKLTP